MTFSRLLLGLVLSVILSPALSFGAATLTWTDMSSGAGQESHFVVERGTSATGPWIDIAHPPQNATAYAFVTPAPGTTWYRVKAVNAAGSSGYSNIVSLIVPPAPLPGSASIVSCVYSDLTPTGLILAMNLDATSGTVATDSSGGLHHGTLKNGPLWEKSGKYGGALSFDGSNDVVTVPDHTALDLTTAVTVSLWAYPTTLTNWRSLVVKEQPVGQGAYGLYANIAGNVPESYVRIGSSYGVAVSPSALPLRTWSHLALTYDGAVVRLYLNGSAIASQARTGSMAATTGPLQIGGASWGEHFAGRIDNVRVYNRALSATEILMDRDTPIL